MHNNEPQSSLLQQMDLAEELVFIDQRFCFDANQQRTLLRPVVAVCFVAVHSGSSMLSRRRPTNLFVSSTSDPSFVAVILVLCLAAVHHVDGERQRR